MAKNDEWPTWKQYRFWLRQQHAGAEHDEFDEEPDVEKLADWLARKLEKHSQSTRMAALERTKQLLQEVDKATVSTMGLELSDYDEANRDDDDDFDLF